MNRTTWTWVLGGVATAALAYAAYRMWQRRQYKDVIQEGSFTIKVKK